jgi:hypothetical protein
MKVWIADAHAHVQRLVSVVKMATVLDRTTEEQRSVMHFSVATAGVELQLSIP